MLHDIMEISSAILVDERKNIWNFKENMCLDINQDNADC